MNSIIRFIHLLILSNDPKRKVVGSTIKITLKSSKGCKETLCLHMWEEIGCHLCNGISADYVWNGASPLEVNQIFIYFHLH